MPFDEGNREGKSRIEQMAAACIHRLYAQMDEHPHYLQYGARAGIQVDDEGAPPGNLMLTMVLEYVITPPKSELN
jgi:hypothetical protein